MKCLMERVWSNQHNLINMPTLVLMKEFSAKIFTFTEIIFCTALRDQRRHCHQVRALFPNHCVKPNALFDSYSSLNVLVHKEIN